MGVNSHPPGGNSGVGGVLGSGFGNSSSIKEVNPFALPVPLEDGGFAPPGSQPVPVSNNNSVNEQAKNDEKSERQRKKLELSESFQFFHNQVLLKSQSGSPLKDQLEKALKQIDTKLDKLGGIGAYKGRRKTLAEKRQLQREVRERAKEWLREQESKLRKKLVAKYQDVRKKAIQKSFEELEHGGNFYMQEIKRRKEKITEMIDNNIKRRINVEIEKVKIQEWTPEVVLAKVSKEFKKAARDEITIRELEISSGATANLKGGDTNKKKSSKKIGFKDDEKELTGKACILPALVIARKRGRRISQIKIDNARERDGGPDATHENTFGLDLTNHKKSGKSKHNKTYRSHIHGGHTSHGLVHLMHKTRKPTKNPYHIKQHHTSKAKEDANYLSDAERVKLADYLMLEGPLNTQKFPKLHQLVYLSLPFCNLGHVGIKNLSDILHLCKSLRHLDVSGNDIDPDTVQVLLNAIENSREIPIHSLELSSNNIGMGTIVGSASFNLLVIIGIYSISIPRGQLRKIDEMLAGTEPGWRRWQARRMA